MHWSAFQLARRVAQSPHGAWSILIVGITAGIFLPLLVLDLGLIVQLQVSQKSAEVPRDLVLGPFVDGRVLPWPFFHNPVLCLFSLVGAGWLAALLETSALVILRRSAHELAQTCAGDLRHKIYRQAFRLGPYDLLGATRTRPEELFSEKVETIRRGFVYWWIAIPHALVAITALLVMAALVNFWLTALAVLLSYYVVRWNRALRRQEEQRKERWRGQVVQHESILRDSLHLAPLLKGYSLVEPPTVTFDEAQKQNAIAEIELARADYLLKPMLFFIVLLVAGFLALIIGLAPDVTIAGTVVLCGSLLAAYLPFARLSRLATVLREMDTAANEIQLFLDREPSVVQLSDAKPLERLASRLLLDRVNLADRHGKHLLDDVTVAIPAGERVAVVASDAQTPLAVAGLFLRFYDPTAGRILFDEHDVRRATLDTIRGQTAVVLKDGLLFPGTIQQNITCGDSGFTSMQFNDAVKRAVANDFIRELPDGVATVVGNHRDILRPDQAFRIGLARALLRAPSLLVLQEPEDGGQETIARELDEALQQAAAGRTLIILPGRIATLRSADLICVFHEGKLHGQGKHADLLQTSELYRHLCYVRFNSFRGSV